jgi:hypothetical protein
MTTYHQALKRQSDGRYDFTSSTGSSAAYPLGYCAGWKEPPTGEEAKRLERQFGKGFVERLSAEIEAKRPHQAKYHTDGHATAAEADECYQRYELDQELEFYGPKLEPETMHKCRAPACGEFTAGLATLGRHRRLWLCEKHRNRETVELVLESVRLHWRYRELEEAQRRGAENAAEVIKLTDECAAKGIVLVPGGERL